MADFKYTAMHSRDHYNQGVSSPTEQLSASQEELCSMKLSKKIALY